MSSEGLDDAADGHARTTSRPTTRACSRPSPRWGSRPSRATAAPRSSRRWAWTGSWWSALLHRNGVAGVGGRLRRTRPRGGACATTGPSRARTSATRSSIREASTSGGPAASVTPSTRPRSPSSRSHVQRVDSYEDLQGVLPGAADGDARTALHPARPVPTSVRGRPARSRSRRWSRSARSRGASAPEPCPTARSPRGAPDPGDRHEPPRRQEQHRRGRRGPRPLHSRRPERGLAPAAPSSRWRRAASA